MVFSTAIFVFCFLPVVLVLYHALAWSLKAVGAPAAAVMRVLNTLILLASVVFYAWGEPLLVLVMLGSMLANYLFGLALAPAAGETAPARSGKRRALVSAAVGLNIALLGVFKYFHFGLDSVNAVLAWLGAGPLPFPWTIALPLGISFYTFQLMSYVIDVYRGDAPPCRDLIAFAAYITMFSQLVAGPIIRYADVRPYLFARPVGLDRFASGVRRFVWGLGKKMLIANVVAVPVDAIHALPVEQITAPVAWLAGLGFYLQLYFDFSGYSDMAIGIGRMLGFEFMENFNFPYLAVSVRDFWRRWHISLSTWLRDYLYIPLGGNRVGPARVQINLFIVFVLCGLWHGAEWTFVVFGILNGGMMILERAGWEDFAARRFPAVVRIAGAQLYVLLTMMVFRSDSFAWTGAVLKTMFGLGGPAVFPPPLELYLTRDVMLALAAGVLFGFPVLPALRRKLAAWKARSPFQVLRLGPALEALEIGALGLVLLACALELAAGTHNPFIYFRF